LQSSTGSSIRPRTTSSRGSCPHLIEAGIDASIGTVGDALDNALMESTIGLYKTELIKTPTCSPRTTGNSPAPAAAT